MTTMPTATDPAPAGPAPARCPPADCPAAEWAARQQLAGCYRVFALLGWTELIFNHISLRVPTPGHPGARHFLINPFGLHYSEVTASNLVKIDLAGQPVGAPLDGRAWPVNPAGFTPHATIHGAIADAHCVMHTHTTAGMAVACAQAGLEISNFYAAQLGGRLAYHDFEGITVHADEGPRLLASITAGGTPKPAVVLRNHGLLAWGATLPECFYTLWLMQRACEVQLAGAALGPTIAIPPPVQAACADAADRFYAQRGLADDLMAALLRQVDRVDRSWRD